MERIWPQVNSRVNYPIKRVLITMEEEEVIDMSDPCTVCHLLQLTLLLSVWKDLLPHGIVTQFQVHNTVYIMLYNHF